MYLKTLEIENRLTSGEWGLVADYIRRAIDYEKADKDSEVRKCLKNAIDVANANNESNAANKIAEYLRFF